MARVEISQLLNSLQGLFFRLSHLNLRSRLEAHQGDADAAAVQDISSPLNEHLEALARESEGGAAEVEEEVVRTSQEMADSEKASRPARNRPRVKSLRQRMNGLTKLFKRRTASVVVQPHLSEQLQRRVRQHLNTSLRKARQGDIANAKLYANLASNAVHELTKYMSKDDFNRFNTQICADLKEFRDRDIFKPLNEMLN